MSVFDSIPVAPEDAIFGLQAKFVADTHPKKLNLGIGAYRTEDLKPWVLPVVKTVQVQIASDPAQNHEYLPIEGDRDFCKLSAKLILGEEFTLANSDRIASVQAVSGTGAIRTAAEFFAKFMPGKTVYISDPTWGNHRAIFNACKIEVAEYPYWDQKTLGINLNGILDTINKAPEGSIFLLHACAHNPTGVDPTLDQWKQICSAIKSKKHFTLFDSAYQGFASGDLDKDAAAIRYFASENLEFFVAQSFAKNFGLYGERAGAIHSVTATASAAKAVLSQFKIVARVSFSNPPKYGALIVAAVLGNKDHYAEWQSHLITMSDRIKNMRKALYDALIARKTPGTWNHLVDQIGMFSFTGLNVTQVNRLIDEFHVYLLSNGRISMAGLSTGTIDYLADAIHAVVSESKL